MEENESGPVAVLAALSPEQVEAWLEMLREMGVSAFEGPHFSVTFFDRAPQPEPHKDEDARPYKEPPAITSNFEHPSLWAGGKPPKFPTK